MSPTGIAFTLFLLVVLAIHWLLPRRVAAQNVVLLLASVAFYASWTPQWLPLLLLTTVVDWLAGRYLARTDAAPSTRRAVLWTSLALNLGALGWFKYRDFFADSLGALLGLPTDSRALALVLPLGLSYYTLIRMGYVLDVYFRRVPSCRSPVTFATFTCFFPQMIAGPITRAGQMLPQLERPRHFTIALARSAAGALLLGWFMKAYIADWIAPAVVDPVFANAGAWSAAAHWVGLLGYAVQVFCDFAGYSLIAIGVARLFAIELPANFDRPFLSRNMPEFWRRWHITLNTWLFDYLFAPLASGRGPLYGRVATTMVLVFALSGLWHGARWTFVVWGLLHGLALAAHHHWDAWYRARCRADRRWVAARKTRRYAIAAWALTQAWFVGSLILFRSSDRAMAARFTSGLFGGGSGPGIALDEVAALNLLVAFAFVVWHHAEGTPRVGAWRARLDALPAPAHGIAIGLVIAWMLVFAPVARGSFIYAQF